MMKRSIRSIDVPKLRRNMKNRSRIAETMCYGYLSGFAYVKLVMLWLVCIALDLLIGFRFELLYPVWLLIRNCYDSFRFQGFVSSLQYSAFSVFFVCATATTDLICFVLLPVQLLLFLASTYVWVQFVWHTVAAERGVGSTQVLLWVALVSFEYNCRYRGESPLSLLRGTSLAWTLNVITGGVLANWLGLRDSPLSTADYSHPNVLRGFGVALTAAFAHSSSLTSDLCRPFAAHCIGYPVVTLGFGLKTYMSLWRFKRRQREVSRENEVYGRLLAEALPSLYEGPKVYAACNGASLQEQDTAIDYETELLPSLAICASPCSSSVVTQRKTMRGAAWKQCKPLSSKRVPSNSNGPPRKHHAHNDDDDTASTGSISASVRVSLWRVLWDMMLTAISLLVGSNSETCIDDRISLSSNEMDSEEDMLEQDESYSQPEELQSTRLLAQPRGNAKKSKGTCTRVKGRTRARNLHTQAEYVLSGSATGTLPLGDASASTFNSPFATPKLDEDYVSIDELDAVKTELQAARSQETELRFVLQQAMSTEKQLKSELSQWKAKHEHTDTKLASMTKAREQDKCSMQVLEKRLIEAHAKKNELDKELSAERRSKLKEEHAAARALAAAQSLKSADCGEACKARKADLEREIRATRRDLKAKEELTCVYEDELRQLRELHDTNEVDELHASLVALRDKNHHLEQSLSAENRLKQDLFRVLTDTRSQTELLQQQLRAKDVELMELRQRLSNDTNDACKLSARNSTLGVSSSVRCPPLLSPAVNGVGAMKMSTSVNADQNMELLTAALSGSSYLPYSFGGHNNSGGHLLFDATVSAGGPGINAPSSAPTSTSASSFSSATKFGGTPNSVRST